MTYYQRQRRKYLAHLKHKERRERIDGFLQKAATADQVIAYTLVAILVCCLVLLVVEAAPRILPTVLAWITK